VGLERIIEIIGEERVINTIWLNNVNEDDVAELRKKIEAKRIEVEKKHNIAVMKKIIDAVGLEIVIEAIADMLDLNEEEKGMLLRKILKI